jgi:transposase
VSLRPEPIGPIPAETARVARAAFPKGHPCLRLRDELGPIYDAGRCAPLFPAHGRPAEAPWRLALVTVLQFAEGLSDRQAADAVRDRLAWKYLLGLELTDTGFDFSILSDFRARLMAGEAEQLLLDALLDRCRAAGLVKPRGRQRTDSTAVLAAVRALNRLDLVGETLRHALEALAVAAPAWLRAQAPAAWYDRYGARIETGRRALSQAERDALAATIGADGLRLLRAVGDPAAPAWLRELPAVQTLRQVWVQNYHAHDDPRAGPRLREARDQPPKALALQSPYDLDARFHTKRETSWVGYTVHLTETCDPDRPHLITQVTTVPASTNDVELTDAIQADLAGRDLLPAEHLLDTGYVDAQHLCGSAERGVDLVGPVLLDTSWQAAEDAGFDLTHFAIDWERRTVTCPQGKVSRPWTAAARDDYPFFQVRFAKGDCLACPVRARCTRAATRPRQLSLRPREEHAALLAARQRQAGDEFAARYRQRAGVEGTIAQGVRACGLRRARYRTLPKVRLEHVAIAVGISLQRLDDWWTETPRALTRTSRFVALAAA